jgi:hypothetical protein
MTVLNRSASEQSASIGLILTQSNFHWGEIVAWKWTKPKPNRVPILTWTRWKRADALHSKNESLVLIIWLYATLEAR